MNIKKSIAAFGLGIVVTAAMLFAFGFEQQQTKFGVVDLNKVMQDSNMGTANNDTIRNAFQARQAVLTFMSTHRVLTTEQAQSLRDLSLKETLTAAEKTQLENVKNAVMQSKRNFDQLQQKAEPTEDDRNLLGDYNQRMQNTARLLQQWDQEFTQSLGTIRDDLQTATLEAARVAVSEVARKGSYTMVFESQIAIYGANDVTAEAIQTMNARK